MEVRVEIFTCVFFEVYIDHGFERCIERIAIRIRNRDGGDVAQMRRGFRMVYSLYDTIIIHLIVVDGVGGDVGIDGIRVQRPGGTSGFRFASQDRGGLLQCEPSPFVL